MNTKENVIIYCDGACAGNPGKGSWGVVIVYPNGKRKELQGRSEEEITTNQRMELMAAIVALEAVEQPCSAVVYSDSTYVVTGMSPEGFAYEIKKLKKGKTPPPRPNLDLWERLKKASESHDVSWNWIKGHDGNVENERADELANSVSH